MTETETTFGAVVERSPEFPTLPTDAAVLGAMLGRERCIIFRGFDATVEAFEEISSALSDDFHTYRGGGFTVGKLSRSTVNNNKTLMTATGSTQDFPMPLHGEMYYLGGPPDLIWFYCQVPVESGGQTTIGDAQQIFRDLPPVTQRLFRERRIRYDRRIPDGDWQVTFQIETREGAEEFCRNQGLQLAWDEDGSALTQFHTSALRESAAGELAFINSLQLIALGEMAMRAIGGEKLSSEVRINLVVRWEDGTPIEPEILKDIERATSRNEVEVSWQRGDIILVDNRSVMHGRRGSSGSDRKILVRMGNLRAAQG
jgi:Taurine catabolism dioxygenase TauD, TfdA family